MSYDGADVEEWIERAAIMEFDGKKSRADAERDATVRTRPPTIPEAVEWIKKNANYPYYCRECLTLWKARMGVSAAKQVFDQAPESVRTWIKNRRWT